MHRQIEDTLDENQNKYQYVSMCSNEAEMIKSHILPPSNPRYYPHQPRLPSNPRPITQKKLTIILRTLRDEATKTQLSPKERENTHYVHKKRTISTTCWGGDTIPPLMIPVSRGLSPRGLTETRGDILRLQLLRAHACSQRIGQLRTHNQPPAGSVAIT